MFKIFRLCNTTADIAHLFALWRQTWCTFPQIHFWCCTWCTFMQKFVLFCCHAVVQKLFSCHADSFSCHVALEGGIRPSFGGRGVVSDVEGKSLSEGLSPHWLRNDHPPPLLEVLSSFLSGGETILSLNGQGMIPLYPLPQGLPPLPSGQGITGSGTIVISWEHNSFCMTARHYDIHKVSTKTWCRSNMVNSK